MVAVGGHFLAVTPCNNWMGHGFYQFSPELFFRAFSEEHGFKLEHMFICRFWRGRWYRVSDSKVIGQRVELINNYPTSLLVQAKRLRKTEIFAIAPQQWGYEEKPMGEVLPVQMTAHKSAYSFVKRIKRRIRNVMLARRRAAMFMQSGRLLANGRKDLKPGTAHYPPFLSYCLISIRTGWPAWAGLNQSPEI